MVKYKAFMNKITPYEVIRETDKTINFIAKDGREMKDMKVTSHYFWKDTFEECVSELIDIELRKIEENNAQIKFSKGKIKQFKAMKNENTFQS